MLRRLPPLVDRSFAKAVAYKRLFTGACSLVGAIALVVLGFQPHPGTVFYAFFGAAVFSFVGVWALRDGVRVLRELNRG